VEGIERRSRDYGIYEVIESPVQGLPRKLRTDIAVQKQIEDKPILESRGSTRRLELTNAVIDGRLSRSTQGGGLGRGERRVKSNEIEISDGAKTGYFLHGDRVALRPYYEERLIFERRPLIISISAAEYPTKKTVRTASMSC